MKVVESIAGLRTTFNWSMVYPNPASPRWCTCEPYFQYVSNLSFQGYYKSLLLLQHKYSVDLYNYPRLLRSSVSQLTVFSCLRGEPQKKRPLWGRWEDNRPIHRRSNFTAGTDLHVNLSQHGFHLGWIGAHCAGWHNPAQWKHGLW